MSKSDYSENAVINYWFRGLAMPTVPGLHISLFTAAPTDAGGGTEISGNGYARVLVARSTGAWASPTDASGNQQTSNTAAVVFPASTGPWGTATHFGIHDAATGGNLLYLGPLSPPRLIAADVQPEFPAGSLKVQEG